MTRLQLNVGLVLALLVTLSGGFVHGRLSGRWGACSQALQAAAQLESLPDQVGLWSLEESSTLGETERLMLQPYGYVNRTYVHLDTGQKVSLFVLLGPVGQTAVHNPEVCYSSRHYTITQPQERVTLRVDGHRTDELWAMTFRANSLEGGWLRTYFGWSDGTRWEAAKDGRIKFAGLPYLFKLQLAAYLPARVDPHESDACKDFLTDFIPVLRTHMIPAAGVN